MCGLRTADQSADGRRSAATAGSVMSRAEVRGSTQSAWCCVAVYSGLAIDVANQKLYYANRATSGGKVGEVSTDGTAHRVLDEHKDSKPHSIVLDADNRFALCAQFSNRLSID